MAVPAEEWLGLGLAFLAVGMLLYLIKTQWGSIQAAFAGLEPARPTATSTSQPPSFGATVTSSPSSGNSIALGTTGTTLTPTVAINAYARRRHPLQLFIP